MVNNKKIYISQKNSEYVLKLIIIYNNVTTVHFNLKYKPEALKSLYRSPGYKKKKLVLCKNYVLQW